MEIRTYGDPVLRKEAELVKQIDGGVKQTCETMVEAMIRANGVGIAAPQIGISKRIIALDIDGNFHVMINPQIVERSEDDQQVEEGCLSIPGVNALVTRRQTARIKGFTLDEKEIEIEGEGLMARAIQHEIDHLNGVLFIDHIGPTRRRFLLKEYNRKQKESEE